MHIIKQISNKNKSSFSGHIIPWHYRDNREELMLKMLKTTWMHKRTFTEAHERKQNYAFNSKRSFFIFCPYKYFICFSSVFLTQHKQSRYKHQGWRPWPYHTRVKCLHVHCIICIKQVYSTCVHCISIHVRFNRYGSKIIKAVNSQLNKMANSKNSQLRQS